MTHLYVKMFIVTTSWGTISCRELVASRHALSCIRSFVGFEKAHKDTFKSTRV